MLLDFVGTGGGVGIAVVGAGDLIVLPVTRGVLGNAPSKAKIIYIHTGGSPTLISEMGNFKIDSINYKT
jgi:hypothetical protein